MANSIHYHTKYLTSKDSDVFHRKSRASFVCVPGCLDVLGAGSSAAGGLRRGGPAGDRRAPAGRSSESAQVGVAERSPRECSPFSLDLFIYSYLYCVARCFGFLCGGLTVKIKGEVRSRGCLFATRSIMCCLNYPFACLFLLFSLYQFPLLFSGFLARPLPRRSPK